MKQDHLYLKITAMLAVFAAVSLGLTFLFGGGTAAAPVTDDAFTVVTSFYPVYVTAQNVADGIEGVEVVNLVDNRAGCLHDYQMTTKARRLLETADVLVINGAGAEPFLEGIDEILPNLTVIDLSQGLPLIASDHVHAHDHDREAHDVDGEAMNAHVWMSPEMHRAQCRTLAEALAKIDDKNEARYMANLDVYTAKINVVMARLSAVAETLKGVPTVVMHDSLAYLAEAMDLKVVASLGIGEDVTADTDAVEAAEKALCDSDKAILLADAQYGADTYLSTLCPDTAVIAADTVVSGDGDKNDWIDAMDALIGLWEAAV